MEDGDLLKLSGVSGGTIAIILLVYKILKSVIGKKVVSNCCGKKLEVGLDVQATTPQADVCLEIKNPLVDGKQIHGQQRINRSQQREDRRDESPERTLQVPSRQEGGPHPDGNSGAV
jgi:hypothetical protein